MKTELVIYDNKVLSTDNEEAPAALRDIGILMMSHHDKTLSLHRGKDFIMIHNSDLQAFKEAVNRMIP